MEDWFKNTNNIDANGVAVALTKSIFKKVDKGIKKK